VNDNELLTLVREQRDKVPMTVPVEQVISRGRRLRTRRRAAAVAAGLAVPAAAAVAVAALLPAGHPVSHQARAKLTAWTVVKEPSGDIAVTIREVFNPAGLQSKLRADGVPVRVTFGAPRKHSWRCRSYRASRALAARIFPPDPQAPTAAIVIRPSALPAGVGVYIDDTSNAYGYIGLTTGLVEASKQCTGS
jgi:hypothetical protein